MPERTDLELLSIYGRCWVCGAPRTRTMHDETDERGYRQVWQRIVCTKEPVAHYWNGEQNTTTPPTAT